jgi:hypothetical protein
MSSVVWKSVRVNTIVGGGSYFDKYGVYKTASGTGPIIAEWTGIKSWHK